MIVDDADRVDLPSGRVAYLKHEMTAGDQEDYERFCWGLDDKGQQRAESEWSFEYVRLNLVGIHGLDGAGLPPSRETIRGCSRRDYARLLAEVASRNPPLDVLEPALAAAAGSMLSRTMTTGGPTTTSEALAKVLQDTSSAPSSAKKWDGATPTTGPRPSGWLRKLLKL